jgi:proline racemase
VISGLPKLSGSTMSEKMLQMKAEHDWIRRLLMFEPRGHDVMSGALLVDPCHPEADVGVIYIETGGYLPMCGHDTIGFCTALVETGMIVVKEPVTRLKLDTPAGLVEVEIEIEEGKAKQVMFRNIPSFLYKSVTVEVEGIGAVNCDIAYGGNASSVFPLFQPTHPASSSRRCASARRSTGRWKSSIRKRRISAASPMLNFTATRCIRQLICETRW